MVQIIAIGIGAGLAAALMFVSVVTGTYVAFPLFALSALPIAIAALGWGPISGGLAAVVGTAAVALTAQAPSFAAGFALLIGGPAAWIALVAGQPSAAASGPSQRTATYRPLGEVLVHAAGVVAFGVAALGFLIHFDIEAITRELTDAFVTVLAQMPDAATGPTRGDLEPLARLYARLMPFTSAAIVLTLLAFDTWLAARIAALSSRLSRPWTPLPTVRMPPAFVALFAVAVAGSFLPAGLGLVFQVVAGACGFALALEGLATFHFVSRAWKSRSAILTIAYILTFAIGLPIVLWTVLGIADSTTGLRRRLVGGPTT